MKEINFEQIAGNVAPMAGPTFEGRACPDQYLGLLSEIIVKPQFPQRLNSSQRIEHPCLVMILESPHVDEFIGEPGPAKGFTGDMIRKFLPEASDLNMAMGFGLVLINAVQYQCSLGAVTSMYRDQIFRAVWTQGGRENFVARLQAILRPSDIVMNCCTKGSDVGLNKPLRSLVDASLRAHFPDLQVLRRMHPASWREKSMRGLAWREADDSGNGITSDLMKIPEPESRSTRSNNVAMLYSPDTLVMIKENEFIRGASCTVLVMGDGSRRQMKTSTFDPDGSITQKAKALIGSRVSTTCWDAKRNPGRWTNQNYFRNIFAIEQETKNVLR
jgi:hypothetical protein